MTIATTPAQAAGVRSRVSIGKLFLDKIDLASILALCSRAVEEKQAHHIVTANLQFLSTARKNGAFAKVVNQADIVVADGMPLVWLSKLHGTPLPERITGHDLLHRGAELAAAKGYTIFLLGGAPGSAERSARRLQSLYPGLKIAGTFQGDFGDDGLGASESIEEATMARLRDAKPDFLFVALGCPKQEYWIRRHIDLIKVPVCVGIGSVLDVVAGQRNRAPRWMQRTGLEWLYRLKQEPLRLGRRYLLRDAPTVMRLGSAGVVRRLRSRRHAQPAPTYTVAEARPQLAPGRKQP